MTLIFGFVGSDGALMASDGQATEADETRHSAQKIWRAGDLLFGYGGYEAVRQPLETALTPVAQHLQREGIRDEREVKEALCDAGRPVLDALYKSFVTYHALEHAGMIGGALLVLGHGANGHWLLEIDGRNLGTSYTERGFHAIGSGSGAAQVARAFFEHYDPRGRPLADLRLLAVRTLDTCISVVATGIGEPIDVWQSSKEGFARLPKADLDATREGVQQWITIERESLDAVNAPLAGEPDQIPILKKDG